MAMQAPLHWNGAPIEHLTSKVNGDYSSPGFSVYSQCNVCYFLKTHLFRLAFNLSCFKRSLPLLLSLWLIVPDELL